MYVLVVRHAIAMEREEFARHSSDDALRPLTLEGQNKMYEAAKGLRKIIPNLGFVLTSPYVRARQTAEILTDVIESAGFDEVSELEAVRSPQDLFSYFVCIIY